MEMQRSDGGPRRHDEDDERSVSMSSLTRDEEMGTIIEGGEQK